MQTFIVRARRKQWHSTDYVGTYRASSAAQALTQAGKDSYLRTIMDRRVVCVEAECCCESQADFA